MGLVKYRVTLEIVQSEHETVPDSWDWENLIDAAPSVVTVKSCSRQYVQDCPNCDGTGEEPGAPEEPGMVAVCNLCNGEGR